MSGMFVYENLQHDEPPQFRYTVYITYMWMMWFTMLRYSYGTQEKTRQDYPLYEVFAFRTDLAITFYVSSS